MLTTNTLTPQVKYTLQTTIRRVIYLIFMSLVVLLLWKLADMYKSELIVENGAIELFQTGICLLTTLSFGLQAVDDRKQRPLLLLLAALALAAGIREQDAWCEVHIPYLSWYFCWIFPIAAIVNLCVKRAGSSILHFLQTGSFNMMFTAMVIIIPVAQLLGHRSFLVDLMNEPELNSTLMRRVIEEPVELLGYLQIFLASIEFRIEHLKAAKQA